jgi:hypothetical protein
VYAQGAFGRKQTGSDDEERKKQEAQKAEEAKKKEAERKEAERPAAQRKEAERQEAGRKEAEGQAAQRKEAERVEAQRKEAERQEAGRQEAEGQAAQQKEAERVEAQRKEAERIEAERRAAAARQEPESIARPSYPRGDASPSGATSAPVETPRRPGPDSGAAPARTPDAQPTYRRTTPPGDTSEFERVKERPPNRPKRHFHRPPDYPYAPDYVVIVEEPTVVYVPIVVPAPQPPRPPQPPTVVTVPEPDSPVIAPPPPEPLAPSDAGQPVPIPTTPAEAISQLRQAWMERKPTLLVPLLPDQDPIKVYRNGIYTHSLSPADFYSLTAQAMGELTTEVFRLRVAKEINGKVVAAGVHEYRGPDGTIKRNRITYTLESRAGRWVITKTGFTPVESEAGKAPAGQPFDRAQALGLALRLVPVSLMWIVPDSTASVAARLGLLPLLSAHLRAKGWSS